MSTNDCLTRNHCNHSLHHRWHRLYQQYFKCGLFGDQIIATSLRQHFQWFIRSTDWSNSWGRCLTANQNNTQTISKSLDVYQSVNKSTDRYGSGLSGHQLVTNLTDSTDSDRRPNRCPVWCHLRPYQ